MERTYTLILYIYLLLIKHSLADLWLQGRFNSSKYGDKRNLRHPKLWLHSLDHAVLTAVVSLLFVGIIPALLIGLLDFVLHAIIDYIKNLYVSKHKIKQSDWMFWKVSAVDQAAHYTCYLLYVFLLL